MPVSVKFDFELLSIDFNKKIFINFIHKKQFALTALNLAIEFGRFVVRKDYLTGSSRIFCSVRLTLLIVIF